MDEDEIIELPDATQLTEILCRWNLGHFASKTNFVSEMANKRLEYPEFLSEVERFSAHYQKRISSEAYLEFLASRSRLLKRLAEVEPEL